MTLALIAAGAVIAVCIYACCAISGRCDDADEQLYGIRRS